MEIMNQEELNKKISDFPETEEDRFRGVFANMRVYPGQSIVMTGYIGMGGTIAMAHCCGESLRKFLPASFIDSGLQLREYIRQVPEAAVASKHGVTAMHPVEEGGIYRALWNLAKTYEIGLEVLYEEIPVKQVTVEFCEVFDLNPCRLYSGGCWLMTARNGSETIQVFRQKGIPCQVIGRITEDNDKVVLHQEGKSYLGRPQADELWKIPGIREKFDSCGEIVQLASFLMERTN